jgi:hypothetical protein
VYWCSGVVERSGTASDRHTDQPSVCSLSAPRPLWLRFAPSLRAKSSSMRPGSWSYISQL